MPPIKVGYLVGSIARDSINLKLAKAIAKIGAQYNLELSHIPINELPLYSYDYDAEFPNVAQVFKGSVESSQALIFVTPEYNRSIPGVLKNALDWGSRPWGSNSFAGKPGAVIGASPGTLGTALAQQHLRNVLSYLDVHTLSQPEGYIQYTPDLVSPQGDITDPGTADFLDRWVQAVAQYFEKAVS